MNDDTSNPSSTLVVAEKKNAHKHGGCVGIFCKLFDWNRRFSKKKLFSKKLLAPARVNKVSKKFNGDGNLLKTKHLLTGDVNGGLGSDRKREMRSPGLVAKLMGLDSMPVVKKQNAADKSQFCGNDNLKNVKEVVSLKKGRSRNEFERRPVNRFGADALHIRSVLSRSKKRCPKLASPVKSPKVAKGTSRLIDAATRILEPGLQATNRAKCALTYSNPMARSMSVGVIGGANTVVTSCNVVKPHSSCLNCGHALEGLELVNDAIEQSRILDMAVPSTHERKRSLDTRFDGESEVVLLRSRFRPEDLTGHHQQETVLHDMHLKHKDQVHSEDRIPPRSNSENMHNRRVSSAVAFNDKKDFIAMNRNVSQSQFRLPRQYRVPQDDEGVFRHVECSSSSNSMINRDKITESKLMAGSKLRFSGSLPYPTCVKSQSFVQGDNIANGRKNLDSRSFCPTKMDQSNFVNSNREKKSSSSLLMNGDVLGTLLEAKLKELVSQGENESAAITPQGRTAATILQELISVLTAERPISPETIDTSSSDAAITYRLSQADPRGRQLPIRFSGNHFSPGSVLDASFSNDSCVSSSIDENSGNMLQSDFMDVSIDDPQILHCDTDFSNRETSNNVGVSYLLDHISRVLDRTNLPDMKLSTTYSCYTKEVLFNVELLFGDPDDSERFVDFLLGPFLNELETLAIAAWRNTILFGFQVSKRGKHLSPLKRFLFDCLVECLSVRYDRYSNCGFVEWCRLPRQLNMEALIRLFDYDVGKSASLAGLTVDEIIDWEMSSTSLGKWTDFDVEMFETSAEIGLIILQGLVDEIVVDFMF